MGKNIHAGATDKIYKCWLLVALLLWVTFWMAMTSGCVTYNQRFADVDQAVIDGRYADAIDELESDQEQPVLYNHDLDRVLYHIDLGLLLYYDGQHDQSNRHLSEAERLIEEYYTKSITQAIGSLILNDRVVEYPGEDFEDLYINLFKALNYIALEEYDSAFVEVRRMNEKIKFFETKYNVVREELKNHEQAEAVAATQSANSNSVPFTASALAHFMSMLLYARDGKWDDAAIDYRALAQLFREKSDIYPSDLPDVILPQEWRTDRSEGDRLVLIAFAGISPHKTEESITVPSSDFLLHIALPVLSRNASAIDRIGLFNNDGELLAYFDLLESIEKIAEHTFERRRGIIYTKSILRSLTKTIVTSATTAALHEAGIPIIGELLQIGAAVSEQADLRTVRYLPARVYIHDQLITPEQILSAPWEVRFLSKNGQALCRQVLNPIPFDTQLHIEAVSCRR